MSITVPTMGRTPLEVMSYAAHWCAGYFHSPDEWIAMDVKRGRIVMYDRPHDDPDAQVVRVLRASRTGSGAWFATDGDGAESGMLNIAGTAE